MRQLLRAMLYKNSLTYLRSVVNLKTIPSEFKAKHIFGPSNFLETCKAATESLFMQLGHSIGFTAAIAPILDGR